ncbi:MAG: hypothetical protein ISQ99_00430 [Flavobacteriales bacterium]|nr:hypothetical protein [Flavobacteriales bacterium]
MLNILKKKTFERVGFKINNLGSAIQLSNIILEEKDEFISYNTIRRLFKIVKTNENPSKKTLDIISRFNGYNNYNHFIKTFKYENKWKLQNDIYEILNKMDLDLLIHFIRKNLRAKEDHVTIVIQVLRELFLQKRYHELYKTFEIEELKIENLTYDEVAHIGNGIGLLLRKIKLEDDVIKTLLKIKNYQDLVYTMFVDYANLNKYYLSHIKIFKTIKSADYLIAFTESLENLHCYLNLKKTIHLDIRLKEDYHPILKSRIISQNILNKNKNIIQKLEQYYLQQNNPKLPIEYFYELIISAMISQSFEVMKWIIKKVEKNIEENYIYHIRHVQHYIIMKSFYFASIANRIQFKKNMKQFAVEAASTSYKEMLKVFILVSQYQFAQGHDKFELKKEYKKLSEKLGYALFDENYLILNANP